jgi:hypothetical protein
MVSKPGVAAGAVVAITNSDAVKRRKCFIEVPF